MPGGILALRASLERKLIFPGAATQGRPDAAVPEGGGYELIALHLPGQTKITAQFGRAIDPEEAPAADSKDHATLIFFNGNGSCIAYMAREFEHFRRLGVNVLIPDYPGYGMSDGQPSEQGFYATGDAAYAYVQSRADLNPGRIILGGWSMGAAVAIDLASRRRTLALFTVSAFTTLPATARALVPWFPTSLIVRSRFDNLSKIASVPCPILIAHGNRDRLVPRFMANQLAAATKALPIVLSLPEAAHNDIFQKGGIQFWDPLASFIRNHSGS